MSTPHGCGTSFEFRMNSSVMISDCGLRPQATSVSFAWLLATRPNWNTPRRAAKARALTARYIGSGGPLRARLQLRRFVAPGRPNSGLGSGLGSTKGPKPARRRGIRTRTGASPIQTTSTPPGRTWLTGIWDAYAHCGMCLALRGSCNSTCN